MVGTLDRNSIIALLGPLITSLSLPTQNPLAPEGELLTPLIVSANLKSPYLVILPTVFRKVYTLSIVDGELWTGKKFNLASIGDDARAINAEQTTLRGMEVDGSVAVAGKVEDVEMEM